MYVKPRTWADDDLGTGAAFNQDLRDNIAYLAAKPRVRVYATKPIPIPSAQWTVVPFNGERWDTDNMHDTGSVETQSKLVCRTPGVWRIYSNILWDSAHNGVNPEWRGIRFLINGEREVAQRLTVAGNIAGALMGSATATRYRLYRDDYVELSVLHNYRTTTDVPLDLNILADSATFKSAFGMSLMTAGQY